MARKKGDKLPPPVNGVSDSPLVSVCINAEWIGYLIAFLEPGQYPEYWSGTLEQNRQARQGVRDFIALLVGSLEDCGMSSCCEDQILAAKQFRVASDGWNGEVSNDGGLSWLPDYTDPRLAIPIPLPRIPTGAPSVDRCVSANNEVESLQDAVDQFASSTGSAFTILIDVLLTLIGVGLSGIGIGALIAALAYPIALAISKLGETAYRALFTEEVWNQVRCALYCACDDSGNLSVSEYNQFLANIRLMVDGDDSVNSAKTNIYQMVATQGYAGTLLNITFGSGTDTGCDACGCGSCDMSTWVNRNNDMGDILYQDDHEVIASATFSGGNYYVQIKSANPNECCVLEVSDISGHYTSWAAKPCGYDQEDESGWNFSYHGEYATGVVSAISPSPMTVSIHVVGSSFHTTWP